MTPCAIHGIKIKASIRYTKLPQWRGRVTRDKSTPGKSNDAVGRREGEIERENMDKTAPVKRDRVKVTHLVVECFHAARHPSTSMYNAGVVDGKKICIVDQKRRFLLRLGMFDRLSILIDLIGNYLSNTPSPSNLLHLNDNLS